jgi:uncharacterized protein
MSIARALLVPLLLCVAVVARAQMPEIVLTAGSHPVTVEVAHTGPTRMQGLMHRRILPEDRGMLFVFPDVERHARWVMTTHIPLSVAFLDERGVILNIEDMKPHTQDSHPAAKPAKYALEVNLGWFRKRGIRPGAKIEGLEKAPPAR